MLETLNWTEVGEQPFFFQGAVGKVEAILTLPEKVSSEVAILGHPHPLQGGTMNNKVITTMVRAFKAANIPSIRFNFRGQGRSQGVHDHGIGEAEDMVCLSDALRHLKPQLELIYGGFSFGSFVAAKAASARLHRGLLMVAPPVTRYDFESIRQYFYSANIFMGDADEVVCFSDVVAFSEKKPVIPLVRFSGVGHFFHGHLTELKEAVSTFITTLRPLK